MVLSKGCLDDQIDYFRRVETLHKCLSCGNEFAGDYCNVCGEKVIRPDDRKLKHFLGELVNALTFADSKLWRTLKMMLISPGQLSADFVDGKRKRLMKPIAIFFLANLMYFLFPFVNTFTTNLQLQTTARFVHSPIASKWVENTIKERQISKDEYAQVYDAKTTELSKLLLIMMAPIMTLFFVIIHLGSKRNLIADHLTISVEMMAYILIYIMEAMSIMFILVILIFPIDLRFLFSNFYLTSFSLAFLAYFFFKMERDFYAFGKIRSAINTVLCLVSIGIALELYRGLLFFITFWSI